MHLSRVDVEMDVVERSHAREFDREVLHLEDRLSGRARWACDGCGDHGAGHVDHSRRA